MAKKLTPEQIQLVEDTLTKWGAKWTPEQKATWTTGTIKYLKKDGSPSSATYKTILNSYNKPTAVSVQHEGKQKLLSIINNKPSKAVAPDNEDPTLTEPKNDKENAIDRFIKEQFIQTQVKKEPKKYITVGCSITTVERDKLNQIAKALGKSGISEVIKSFCKQLLKDGDAWIEMVKNAKN